MQNRCFFGKFCKIFLQLFVNTNGWVLQKFRLPFYYNTYVCLWTDEKRIIDKWVIVAKWYWCQVNEHKSCICHVLFFKTFLYEKNKILQCKCWYKDVNVKISKWPLKCVIWTITIMWYIWSYSSKQDWIREKHLTKQTVKSLQGLRNVY